MYKQVERIITGQAAICRPYKLTSLRIALNLNGGCFGARLCHFQKSVFLSLAAEEIEKNSVIFH